MKIEAEIWRVLEGKLLEVKVDDQIFIPKILPTETEAESKQIFNPDKKGPVIDYKNHQAIRQNVAHDFNDAIKNDASYAELGDVLKKWYQDIKLSTVKVYISAYKKHSISPKFTPKKRKKYRRRKPQDAVGYDKSYRTWVRNDEHALVMRALRKFNFKATTANIVEETRLKKSRVYIVIHYMLEKGEAYKNRDRTTRQPIYCPKDGKETKVFYP